MLDSVGKALHRIFLRDRPQDGGWVELDPPNAHHVREVLRLRPGQQLRALVPDGHDLVLQITATRPGRVACTVAGRVELPPEPSLKVRVYQGLTRGERFEYVLQKCTEIGAYEFCPVITRRTVIKPSHQRSWASRLARWKRIVEEAALQSGRAAIPPVHVPATLSEALPANHQPGADDGALRLVADEAETWPLGKVLQAHRDRGPGRAHIVIGPEGGLDRDEVQAMTRAGFDAVSLVPRLLRTETAGPVLLSVLLYELADLGGRRG